MIIKQNSITCNIEYLKSRVQDIDHCAFFDIETTGFRAGASHLYLIGAACHLPEDEETKWHVCQWLAERPQDETALLRAFSAFLQNYSILLHFNGDRFDIPYMKEKYSQYQLPSPFAGIDSIDLYQEFRPLKSFLKLERMNQKSLERFLGLDRQDLYDGGRLIPVYRDYCKTGSEEKLHLLLLHNAEDVSGMFTLTALYSYLSFLHGSYFQPTAEFLAEQSGKKLLLTFVLKLPVPAVISVRTEYGHLILRENIGKLLIPMQEGTMYFFFQDYKNYYYLPQEDQAMHKSIASYVDKAFRQPARADNCYIKKEGCFLPQPDECFAPAFRRTYKDSLLWFSPEEGFPENQEQLRKYLEALINKVII